VKLPRLITFALLLLSAPALADPAVLVLDKAHDGANMGTEAYRLPACNEITLDLSGIELATPAPDKARANEVQIVMGKDNVFTVPIAADQQRIVVNKVTAKRLNARTKSFPGFVAGKTVAFGIGHRPDAKSSEFYVAYAGIIEIVK
jgi:hypothetical protein